jgi:hypothetical protein
VAIAESDNPSNLRLQIRNRHGLDRMENSAPITMATGPSLTPTLRSQPKKNEF